MTKVCAISIQIPTGNICVDRVFDEAETISVCGRQKNVTKFLTKQNFAARLFSGPTYAEGEAPAPYYTEGEAPVPSYAEGEASVYSGPGYLESRQSLTFS